MYSGGSKNKKTEPPLNKLLPLPFLNVKRFLIILSIASFGLLAFKADDYFEISKNLEIFASVYKEVNTTYVDEVKPGALIRAAIDGMLKTLDPYTNFYSEAQAEDYRYEVTGTYAGIGASITTIDGLPVIDRIYKGYSAEKEGLQSGDIILKIDNVETEGKKISEVNDLLKGNAGTTFTLVLKRGDESISKTLTRQKIVIKNVPYFGMLNQTVGYIKLTGFTPKAGKEVRDAVIDLKAKGATSLVLDLRGNGGGLLNEAINIVNVFVPRGQTVVITKGKYKEDEREYKTQLAPVDTEIPLAILIDGYSASASEIVSGALQDLDRAVLIGQNSFGKGLVQQTKPLKYNTQMKVTIAKYYIPSGRLIQRLDYGNKKEGKAIAVADSAKHTFYTKNGRPVVDGEGIQPDVEIEKKRLSKIAQSLIKNNLIFTFANNYRLKNNSIPKVSDFQVDDAIYQEFRQFLENKEYTYTTQTEEALIELVEQSKKDNYYDLLLKELDILRAELEESKEADLKTNKSEIAEILETEIARRFYFEEGKIESTFDDDIEIAKAIELLQNTDSLTKILNP
jgi:carboxyl-terminal processing protease